MKKNQNIFDILKNYFVYSQYNINYTGYNDQKGRLKDSPNKRTDYIVVLSLKIIRFIAP